MNNILIKMTLPILLVLVLIVTNSHANAAGNIIDGKGKVFNKTIELIGSEHNNKTYKNFIIRNVAGDGVYIKDVENLTLENILVENVTRSGIRLGISGSTKNVTIKNSYINNTGKNGINAGQRINNNIDHKGLRIIGNHIQNTGLEGGKGLEHGIYVQTQDVYIAKNIVRNSKDGNGISVRSSGLVENNTVINTAKSGISYYSDHMSGKSRSLIIRKNRVYNAGMKTNRNCIDILAPVNKEYAIRNVYLRGNHLINCKAHIDGFYKQR